MSRTRRALLILLVVVLVVVVVLPVGGWLFLRRSLPRVSGTARLQGLNGPVDIVRESHGIPYIYASTDHDAFFALGYVHAQDRLWQMEMQRRVGAGRLSEVLGESTLKTDEFLRTLGPYRSAQSALQVISPEGRAALEAYAAGVNVYLAEGHPLPPEFVILGFKPEPWQPIDSLVWAKMLSWDLGGDYELDLLRAQLASSLGPERAAQLFPGYPAGAPTILTASATQYNDLHAVRELLRGQFGMGDREVGSNNWVATGSRTASGKPLLANDPHLRAQIPSIWYLAGIQGDKLHVAGATLPGEPFVVIGHNDRIAWGETNLNPDVQDIFIERANPANADQVEVNGQWVDMQIVPEDITVKGRTEPVHWAARATRHGPVISDVSKDRGNTFALRWTALDPGDTTADAFLKMNYASNWDEYKNALRGFVAPAQNFVYADVDGNVGYFGPGHIPIRAKGDGSLPVPGWNDDYAWTGWIPFDQLPQAYNPADGYIATANNKVVPPNYPYFITNDWSSPYRAERIVQLLTAKQGLTVQDYETMQGDLQSGQALELLPVLHAVQPDPKKPEQAQALDYVRKWDGTTSLDSVATTIYEAWYTQLHQALLENKLAGTLGDVPTMNNPEFLHAVQTGSASNWCDDLLTPTREDCQATAREALDEALKLLTKTYGSNMARWQWGTVRVVQFAHNPFSQVAALKPIFHRSIAKGGDSFTVNVAPYDLAKPFDSAHIPSYRQIVDLSNFDNSVFMHTTGQSGNVLSPHYADLLPLWASTEYVPMYWDKTRLKNSGGTATLTLTPTDGDQ